MNNIFSRLLLFGTFIIISCNENSKGITIPKDSTTTLKKNEKNQAIFDRLIWTTDFDTIKHDFVLRQTRKVNSDTLSPQKVINQINSVWAEIFLQFKRISHDTIYVSIPDSYYLTERIGTSGASNYMASTTFSLTEVKGIKYVTYDFEEGEHLSPGTMKRDDYKNFR